VQAACVSACEDCGGVWLADGRLGELMALPDAVKERLIHEVTVRRTGRSPARHACMLCPRCRLILAHAPMLTSTLPVHTCSGCTANFMDPEAFRGILFDCEAPGAKVPYGSR
jgi:Zn-finger nucleic acid-binding protein